jgi:4-nitrophenyl phosphatase
VLWSGDHLFPGVPETIGMLRKRGMFNPKHWKVNRTARRERLTSACVGKQLVFVTNNSTKSRADYKKKFDKMGIEAKEVLLIPPGIHGVASG